jgi:cellulose synthase/poly-beta-1,6-N-acetylglucosamine synthase-like glycosyltransferase
MVADTVASMLAIDYPQLEVVVVNDGSGDDTLGALQRRFDLEPAPRIDIGLLPTREIRSLQRSRTHPQLLVVDKANGGKADALNAGLVHASGRLVCAVDADTIIEPDALIRLVEPFRQRPGLVAAGGSIRPVNGCRLVHGRVVERRTPSRFLAGVQAAEYRRAFLFGRLGWNRLGGNIIVSGAFGLFDREQVIEAGGYLEDTVGEDMELVLRLRRQAREMGRSDEVTFLPEPMAWTEVPERLRPLARQRNRWHRGLADVLWRHRHAIGRARYGRMGLVVLPVYVLELVAPIVELLGLVICTVGLAFGAVHSTFAASYLLLAYGFAIVLSAVAAGFEDRLDEDALATEPPRRRLRWLLAEHLGYRQLTILWRLWGLVSWVRGDRHWGAQVRQGLPDHQPAPPPALGVAQG